MRTRVILASALALTFSGAALAQEKPFYIGVKPSIVNPDNDRLENATNGSVVLGFQIPQTPFGIEAEAGTTLSDGDVKNSSANWNMNTVGVFATARTPGDVYVKGRAGWFHRDVTVEADTLFGTVKAKDKEDSEAWGAGIGWKLGAANVEAEYTRVDQDFDFYSVGLNANF